MRINKRKVQSLAKDIRLFVAESKLQIAQTFNVGLLATYWYVGKMITVLEETEQYDESSLRMMLLELDKVLTIQIGSEFARINLFYMRSFYKKFSPVLTVSERQNKIIFDKK